MKTVSRLFATALVVAIVFAFSVNAFAAGAYTTVTTYNVATGKVEVASEATGLTDGDEVAYLVTTSDNTPIYIEQDTVVGNKVNFGFKTTTANLNANAVIQFGTMSGDAVTETAAKDSTIMAGTYTVSVQNGAGGLATAEIQGVLGDKAIEGATVVFTIDYENGYELEAITVNGVAVDGLTADQTTFTLEGISEDTTVVFSYKATEVADAPVVTGPAGSLVIYTGDAVDTYASIAMTNYENLTQYGILFARNSAALEGITIDDITMFVDVDTNDFDTEVIAFPALQMNGEGAYVVRLADGGTNLLDAGYATRAYAIYNGVLYLGDNVALPQ